MIFSKYNPKDDEYIAYINENYAVIYENMNTINEFLNGASYLLEAEDKGIIQKKIDEFIYDVHDFTEKAHEDIKSEMGKAKVFVLIGLGLSLLGLALSAFLPLIGIIVSVSSLIAIGISVYHENKAAGTYKKLKEYKIKLKEYSSKTDDKKAKEKIDKIIDKIDIAIAKAEIV